MRVLFIGGLVIITACILIGVFVWDRRMANDRYKVLKQMWDKTKEYDTRAYVPIQRLELIRDCELDYKRFSIVVGKLRKDGLVEGDPESISFTDRGVTYYDFTILPKFANK